jgi:hypothetical protein
MGAANNLGRLSEVVVSRTRTFNSTDAHCVLDAFCEGSGGQEDARRDTVVNYPSIEREDGYPNRRVIRDTAEPMTFP